MYFIQTLQRVNFIHAIECKIVKYLLVTEYTLYSMSSVAIIILVGKNLFISYCAIQRVGLVFFFTYLVL